MADLRTMSDDRLEDIRLDLCRRGDLMGANSPSLRAVQEQLRAVAKEQTRRADGARQRVGRSNYLQAA